MPPRNRPTAFSVSFGEPGPSTQVHLQRGVSTSSDSPFTRSHHDNQRRGPASSSPAPYFEHGSSQRTLVGTQPQDGPSVEKRKETMKEWGSTSGRPEKRARSSLAPKQYYDPDEDVYEVERPNIMIFGEDPDEEDGRKPMRMLTDFVIFDSAHDNELATLDDLLNPTMKRHLEAVGNVAPVFMNEEDAGQDDDVVDDAPRQKLRTTVIMTLDIDYTSNDFVWIQTQYAFYALKRPRDSYRGTWTSFYKRHRVAQLVMTFANQTWKNCTHDKVMDRFAGAQVEDLAGSLTPRDIEEAEIMMLTVLDENKDDEDYTNLRASAYIQELKRKSSRQPASSRPRPSIAARPQQLRKRLFDPKNIDLRVLQPEHQTNTTVTPLIYKLAEGLFPEQLKLLDSSVSSLRVTRQEERRRRKQLEDLLHKSNMEKGTPIFRREHRIEGQFWSRVARDGVEYEIGDVVILPAAPFAGRKQEEIPRVINDVTVPAERTIADFFWFARIVYFDQRENIVHVRWFEHSSKTLMQEIHDPFELFLTDMCDTQPINLIVDKVAVTHRKQSLLQRTSGRFAPGARRSQNEDTNYFYSFKYNQGDGSFVAVSDDDQDLVPGPPPDSCKVCSKIVARDQENSPQSIRNGEGVAFRGANYHINDFVMLRSGTTDDLTCTVAQIIGFNFDNSARSQGLCMLGVEPLGRINDILKLHQGDEIIVKDERHFYLTSNPETLEVNAIHLIRKCRVVNYYSLPVSDLKSYLAESPYHFYVQYVFPRLKVTNWASGRQLNGRSKRPEICIICWREDKKRSNDLRDFAKRCTRKPLRAFDPFGGVGTFALSMQEAGCLKLTHAVEISPSAALTLKKNSPETKVFNQCSNLVLQDAVKLVRVPGYTPRKGHPLLPYNLPPLTPLPVPPKPGEIDCIVAGFPCQPHSRLNMYQKASDRKSHLMLNLLSWVDFLEPKFCYFENVRGFLQYNLNAVQANRYRVKGGIQAGGLKFLVRALVAMGYQVRFATLQAAHYGLPQTRVRFFLIAARMDQPMPKFPTPLYAFPVKEALEVKFTHNLVVRPINTELGVAPFRHITVDDAIGDLYRWDWQNPRGRSAPPRTDPVTGKTIRIIACEKSKAVCAPFSADRVRYHTAPQTQFQRKAREKQNEITDLQHITRVLREDTISRVCHIPLKARADYHALFHDRKNLPDELFEWGWSDPKSAVARHGFRRGLYGRLDAEGWFNTTVTNVEPTAKQSWVLNPYCKRMVTVRELARSQGFPDHFRFYCVDAPNVKTMQREIGNAVPWQVGYALGRELRDALFEEWLGKRRESQDDIDSDD